MERLNKEIAKAIRSTLLDRIEFVHSWSFAIPHLVLRLLSSITHSSTHQPPMRLHFGDKSLHLDDCLLPSNLSSGPASELFDLDNGLESDNSTRQDEKEEDTVVPSLQSDDYITKRYNHSLECVMDIARITLNSLVDKRRRNSLQTS